MVSRHISQYAIRTHAHPPALSSTRTLSLTLTPPAGALPAEDPLSFPAVLLPSQLAERCAGLTAHPSVIAPSMPTLPADIQCYQRLQVCVCGIVCVCACLCVGECVCVCVFVVCVWRCTDSVSVPAAPGGLPLSKLDPPLLHLSAQ